MEMIWIALWVIIAGFFAIATWADYVADHRVEIVRNFNQ